MEKENMPKEFDSAKDTDASEEKAGIIKKLFKFFTSKELITYAIFGVLTTFVNYAVYWLISRVIFVNTVFPTFSVFGIKITSDVQTSFVFNGVAWIAAVIFAYFTNKFFVFHSRTHGKSAVADFFKFIASRLTAGIVEILLPSLLMIIFIKNDFVAKAIVSVVTIILNYLFTKFLVFKKSKKA